MGIYSDSQHQLAITEVICDENWRKCHVIYIYILLYMYIINHNIIIFIYLR